MTEQAENQIWIALADPTRRQIFELVAKQQSDVQSLANQMPVSRPAVSQHLKFLSDAGLVSVTPKGRKNIYRTQPKALAGLRDWLETYWQDGLTRFAIAADEDEEENNNG
jgi:DNA-binding transcriptional ArsR family regulator